jgi:aspartate dehydrogenase
MADVRPVAIIGAGTIARAVGQELAAAALPGLSLLGFLTRTPKGDLPGPELATLEELVDANPSVVVEAASHDALRECAEAVLEAGADLVCVSVGALGDADLRDRLTAAAERGGARLIVPSGAVGGLDLLCAAADGGLDEVVVEQRKPPGSVLSEAEADALEKPMVVFEGNVAEAVRRYPKTANVAASVALAGLGFERTRARVVADPALSANQVLLTARGSFGVLTLMLANVPSANPRTSAIVAHSVLVTLRRLDKRLVIPG